MVQVHISFISFCDSYRQSQCVKKKISRNKHLTALWMICKRIPQQNLRHEFSYKYKHSYVPQIIRLPVFYESYKKLESYAPDTWINELSNKLKVFSREILILTMHFIYDSFGFCTCYCSVTFFKLIYIIYTGNLWSI